MQKIKKTAYILSLFFQSLAWLLPMLATYLIFFNLYGMIYCEFWPNLAFESIRDPNQYSLAHRLLLLAIECLPLSITILICHKLAQLFKLYGEGSLFELKNIKLIRQIGVCMIIGQVLNLLWQPLITIALSFNNPPGERLASITIGTTNLSTLITAIILLMASSIIYEANQLKSDAELTI